MLPPVCTTIIANSRKNLYFDNTIDNFFLVCDRLILNQRRLKRRTRSNNVHFSTVENEHQIVVVPEFDLVIGTRLFEVCDFTKKKTTFEKTLAQ